MSEPFSHVAPEVREVMDRSPAERIAVAQADQWVDYPAATAALKRLEDALKHTRASRMENCLLVGDSNNGKSSILRTFVQRNPSRGWMTDEAGTPQLRAIPVLLMDMPRQRQDELFWKAMLQGLACAAPRRNEDLEPFACSLLEQFEVRVLVIDEVHDLLLEGTPRQHRSRLKLLKSLSNRLRLPIVVAGTHEAEAALAIAEEVDNRFEPFVLPRWNLDRNFRGFVAAYERLLPLKQPSGLAERETLIPLYNVCDGTIGRMVRVLKRAAVAAIESGAEKIDAELIGKVATLPYGKERGRAAG
ncbi:TniB family NTP-binding protein [Methylorubrum aminovorans]|uniref:TniB family NTP-binding protein n=1 Tax=Methylorubrum aminovorans TaxID=269069 RepID=UPI003C2AC9B9